MEWFVGGQLVAVAVASGRVEKWLAAAPQRRSPHFLAGTFARSASILASVSSVN